MSHKPKRFSISAYLKRKQSRRRYDPRDGIKARKRLRVLLVFAALVAQCNNL